MIKIKKKKFFSKSWTESMTNVLVKSVYYPTDRHMGEGLTSKLTGLFHAFQYRMITKIYDDFKIYISFLLHMIFFHRLTYQLKSRGLTNSAVIWQKGVSPIFAISKSPWKIDSKFQSRRLRKITKHTQIVFIFEIETIQGPT